MHQISTKYLQTQIKFKIFSHLSFLKTVTLYRRNQRVQVQVPRAPCSSFKVLLAKALHWQKQNKIKGYQTIMNRLVVRGGE